MRFHSMTRGDLNSVAEIKKLSETLENSGYYSVLLTYHSKCPDMLLKAFGASSNDQKLKYMLAIRTYAISPEYMAMVCRSYNEEFPNKLILNVVSGDINKIETSVEDIVKFSSELDNPEKRLEYTYEWLNKFKNLALKYYYPELIMGGHSDKTKNMANEFDATHLSQLDMYRDYINKPSRIINNKQMVVVTAIIRNNKKDALEFIDKSHKSGIISGDPNKWVFGGTKEEIKQSIKDLKKIGVTDILIHKTIGDDNSEAIHDMIKELVAEEK